MHLSTPAWEFPEGRVIANSAQPVPDAGPEDVDWLRVVLKRDDVDSRGLGYSHVLRIGTRGGKADVTVVGERRHRLGVGYETYYAFLRKA